MPPHGVYPPLVGPPRAHESKAVASLVLGIASMTCLGFVTGLPAIVLGALARRDIDRSGGALAGANVAAAGIVSGIFGTGLSLVLSVFVLASVLQSTRAETADVPVRVPVAAGTRSYGSLDVVDVDEARPLHAQLVELARRNAGTGRTVLLQTYVRSSPECAQVAASLPDSQMQRALANVTLVRVDVEAFEDELEEMRVETDTVPWFYKLDSASRPTDAISADEWDDNVPENMAPVLAGFARGTLRVRRTAAPLGTAL